MEDARINLQKCQYQSYVESSGTKTFTQNMQKAHLSDHLINVLGINHYQKMC